MSADGMRSPPPEGAHRMTVEIAQALQSQDWWKDGPYAIEPPDAEDEPDNFGISHDGELLYIVRVEQW